MSHRVGGNTVIALFIAALLAAILLAAALAEAGQSTPRKMLLPGDVSLNDTGGYRFPSASNTLYCWTIAAPHTMTNLRKMAVYLNSASPTTFVSFGIFPNNDAGAKLGSIEKLADVPLLTNTAIAPFTMTAGVLYRLCHCAATGNVVTYTQVQSATSCCEYYGLSHLIATFHPSYVGTGTSCTGGALPPTTGALTPLTTPVGFPDGNDYPRIPVFLVEQ